MKLNRIKPCHDDGGSNAQRNHQGSKPGAKPSDGAMPTDFAYTHQCRLTNKEDRPRGESRGMNPQNEGPRHRGMKQVFVDGTLEAGEHNRRQQQRHCEIEIATQNPVTTGEGSCAQCFPRDNRSPDAFYIDSGHRKDEPGLHFLSPGPREHTLRVPTSPSFSACSRGEEYSHSGGHPQVPGRAKCVAPCRRSPSEVDLSR